MGIPLIGPEQRPDPSPQVPEPLQNETLVCEAPEAPHFKTVAVPQRPLPIIARDPKLAHALGEIIGKDVPEEAYKNSTLSEFTELPANHPAKTFAEGEVAALDVDVKRASRITNASTKEMAYKRAFAKHHDAILGMKSAKAFYDSAGTILDNFTNIAAKKDVVLLYPAAGFNIGSLSMAMAMLDKGTRSAEMIFTEVDESSPAKALDVLQKWANANKDIRIVSSDIKEGKPRQQIVIDYKGKTIKLTYSMKESDEGLYFKKSDMDRADVVIIHDVGDYGMSDWPLLKQVLDNTNAAAEQKAIIMTNELDMAPIRFSDQWTHEPEYKKNLNAGFSPLSVLPFRGWVINDSYGCSYELRSSDWDCGQFDETCTNIIGEVGNRKYSSAVIFSTGTPLASVTTSPRDKEILMALSLYAGGDNKYHIYKDTPTTERGAISSPLNKQILAGIGPAEVLQFVSSKYLDLPPEDREYLALVTLRYLAMRTFERSPDMRDKDKLHQMYMDNTSYEFRWGIKRAAVKYGLYDKKVREEELNGCADYQAEDTIEYLGIFKGAETFKKLDNAILKKQRLD